MRLDVPARAVRVVAARRVAERYEQLVALLVRDERDLRATDIEAQRPGAEQLLHVSRAGLDLLGRSGRGALERHLVMKGRIGIEVPQAGERAALVVGERRLAAAPEELVLHPPDLADVHACGTVVE